MCPTLKFQLASAVGLVVINIIGKGVSLFVMQMKRPCPVTVKTALLLRIEEDVGLFITLDHTEPIEVAMNSYKLRRVVPDKKFPLYKICVWTYFSPDDDRRLRLFGTVIAKPELMSVQGKRYKDRLCSQLGWDDK